MRWVDQGSFSLWWWPSRTKLNQTSESFYWPLLEDLLPNLVMLDLDADPVAFEIHLSRSLFGRRSHKALLNIDNLAQWCWFQTLILPRQHCRLSICDYWLSWTNTETAAATPPTVMQNLLRASAQWLVLESAVFWLISPPTWVNWHMKMFLVHFTHYSGAERGNFVRNLWILSYILSLKFGEALLLVRTEYWTNESFALNLRSLWHIPQIWGEAPIGWILCADQ